MILNIKTILINLIITLIKGLSIMITFLQFTIYALCLVIIAMLPFANLTINEYLSAYLILAIVGTFNFYIGSRL